MTFASHVAAQLPERLLVRLISLAYGQFEPEIRHLDEVCGRGGTMVDVGGWYGPWTRRMLGRADQVVVIEPTPLHHVLRRTLPPGVDVIAAAASDHHGEAELWLPPSGGGSRGVSSLHRRDIHGTSIKVPLVTVDGLGLRNVTFMKVDVDGHEVPVLRGAADTIRRDQPRLLVEVESGSSRSRTSRACWNRGATGAGSGPAAGWLPVAAFPLAAHQASTSRVSERGLLARAIWPYPRYINSVLFLPGTLIPRPVEDHARQAA